MHGLRYPCDVPQRELALLLDATLDDGHAARDERDLAGDVRYGADLGKK